MSFRDHPVFADEAEADLGADAVIIGFHDRVVRQPPPPLEGTEPWPVTQLSLQRTTARLAKLDRSDWRVLQHPGMGADHLVIGTGGVYAVTTVRLAGKVLVAAGVMLHNGHCTDHLTQVRGGARRLSARLEAAVRPLLVIDADALYLREEPADVGISSSHRVRKWLERRLPLLDCATVFRVTTLAQRPRTWR